MRGTKTPTPTTLPYSKATIFPSSSLAFLWWFVLVQCGLIQHRIFPSVQVVRALAVPKQELVNRRKSPALWRYDLNNHEDASSLLSQGPPEGPQSTTTATKQKIKLQRPPEVMAPVGGWPQLQAAIANGADAVYVGLTAFSARARAANFDPLTELPQAVQLCHDSRVKLYVALNTLAFPNELQELEQLIRHCAAAQVDALIVQDLGVARLARTIAPTLELHASTQQTITSADGAAFIAQQMGSTRVVLGRELSVAEIEAVASDLFLASSYNNESDDDDDHPKTPVEVEAFVHGALCVSYSGQCFSSEAWGGRSANRGQCAQACRLPYGLIDNGDLKELGDFSYLLSPQDLCGIDHVPALVRAGVACLKIEGRLKDAAYVAATTRAYRQAVDQAWEEYLVEQGEVNKLNGINSSDKRQLSLPEERVTKAELTQLFSRGQDEDHDGLSPGFFDGSQHQHLVRGRSPRHRGVHLGRVLEGSSWKNGLLVALDDDEHSDGSSNNNSHDHDPVKRGDGLVVDRGLAQEEELGGPVFDIHTLPQRHQGKRVVCIRFSEAVEKKWKSLDVQAKNSGVFEPKHAPPGAHVWKTSDATVDKKMKRLSEAPIPKQTKMARVTVEGSVGEALVVTISDIATGRQGVGKTEGSLEPAEKKGLDSQSIEKAIGTLGNTDWELASNDAIDTSGVDASAWCPASWIKEARRQAVENLMSQFATETVDGSLQAADTEEHINLLDIHSVTNELLEAFSAKGKDGDSSLFKNSKLHAKPKISVLARKYDQVDAVCSMVQSGRVDDVDEIIVDFLEVDGMTEAVNRIRQLDSIKVVVASPRIIKPGESGIWRTLLRLEPDGLLVRSTGLLHRMMELGGQGANVDVGVGVGGSEGRSEGDKYTVKIPELIGDFSLNVANPLTAWELLTYGCDRVTASYDLNANGISELLQSMGDDVDAAGRVDVIVHTHIPIFHTEHCVFARFLTNGNYYVDCGHACTRHNVHLRDQTGADNLVLGKLY